MLLGLLFNLDLLAYLGVLVGIQVQLLDNLIVVAQIEGINCFVLVFLNYVLIYDGSELFKPDIDRTRSQMFHFGAVFQSPLLMLGGKVGEGCAQEGLIGTYAAYFRFAIQLVLLDEKCSVQEVCLDSLENHIGSIQVVGSLIQLRTVPHYLRKLLRGGMAGPKNELKLMEHQSLQAN